MKGLTKQLWFIILLSSKTYCSTVCVCFFKQHLQQCMYMYMYIHVVMSCIMVRTELKGLTKNFSLGENLFPCIIASSSAPALYNVCMYVCSYDLHYNVLWGRYASELKGITKKLLFSILPMKKDASMQNCKSIVTMVFECYFFVISYYM